MTEASVVYTVEVTPAARSPHLPHLRSIAVRARAVIGGALIASVLAACSLVPASVNAPGEATPASAAPEPLATPPTEPVPPPTRADVERVTFDGWLFDVVTLPLDQWDVRVDWNQDGAGIMLGDAVEAGDDVVVATNAGIFTPAMVPGGLLVSDGDELRALNLREGGGNFHLMPNGVFAIYDDGTAAVMESSTYSPSGVTFATQSGPALILGGEIHPEFRAESGNLNWRSAVGVSPDGKTVYLAISVNLVNFHTFARMFRDHLGVDDALYLDGTDSGLWVEGARETDALYGPFVGVITASPAK